MTSRLSFATVAHFALEAAGEDIGARVTIYNSLRDVAQRMGLHDEERGAADAINAIKGAEEAQLTFGSLIQDTLGKENP